MVSQSYILVITYSTLVAILNLMHVCGVALHPGCCFWTVNLLHSLLHQHGEMDKTRRDFTSLDNVLWRVEAESFKGKIHFFSY